MLQELTIVGEDSYGTDGRTGLSILASRPLTAREQEVWSLMAAGRSDAEIAERLALNCLTVRYHLSNVLTKLGHACREESVVLPSRSKRSPNGKPGNGSARR